MYTKFRVYAFSTSQNVYMLHSSVVNDTFFSNASIISFVVGQYEEDLKM